MRNHAIATLSAFIISISAIGHAQLKISQVYTGGSTTGYYLNDYVEVLNTGFSPVGLDNYSLQYGSSSGNFGSTASNIYAFPAGTVIQARKYLLIRCGTAGSSGAAVPGYDLSTTSGVMDMGSAGGKVAIVNQTAALNLGSTGTPLPLPDSRVLDLVAYGNSNNGEGGVAANYGVMLNSNQVCVRKAEGLTDTNNNGADIDVLSAGGANTPRNSGSPPVGSAAVSDWKLY